MFRFRMNWYGQPLVVFTFLAVGLASCTTAMGYKDNEPIPVTMKFKTTSDHFYFKLEGMTVEDPSIEPSRFTQPQWVNVGGTPLIVQGAQGVDMAGRGGVQEFVFTANLARRDGFDFLSIPYGKGHMGTQSLEVTYPDVTGKSVTKRFSAAVGPADAEGVWKLPLKAVALVEGESPPPELSKGADLHLLGVWGIPANAAATTITFRPDATATLVNFPDKDGKTLINGEFKYEVFPAQPGQGNFYRWDEAKALYEYYFNFKLMDDGKTLMIGVNEGKGWSMLPKVKS